MQRLLRHKLLIAGATLVAAASAGVAYAATQSPADPQQAFINDVAKRLNVSPAQLQSALKAALIDRLNAAVQAGQLTKAQANLIKQRIESGRFLGRPWRFGFRTHEFFGRGALAGAASYLGLTDSQLLRDLSSGKSLAQIAKARGKSVSGLEQAITTAEKARLDRLVSAGVITKRQEQRVLSRLSDKVSRIVNRTSVLPPMPPGGPWLHGADVVPLPGGGPPGDGLPGSGPPGDGFGPPPSA